MANTTPEGWTNLKYLVGKVDSNVLLGQTVRAVAATDGWGGVNKGDEGILTRLGWSGKASANFDSYFIDEWNGDYHCFEVKMPLKSAEEKYRPRDEEDIL